MLPPPSPYHPHPSDKGGVDDDDADALSTASRARSHVSLLSASSKWCAMPRRASCAMGCKVKSSERPSVQSRTSSLLWERARRAARKFGEEVRSPCQGRTRERLQRPLAAQGSRGLGEDDDGRGFAALRAARADAALAAAPPLSEAAQAATPSKKPRTGPRHQTWLLVRGDDAPPPLLLLGTTAIATSLLRRRNMIGCRGERVGLVFVLFSRHAVVGVVSPHEDILGVETEGTVGIVVVVCCLRIERIDTARETEPMKKRRERRGATAAAGRQRRCHNAPKSGNTAQERAGC